MKFLSLSRSTLNNKLVRTNPYRRHNDCVVERRALTDTCYTKNYLLETAHQKYFQVRIQALVVNRSDNVL